MGPRAARPEAAPDTEPLSVKYSRVRAAMLALVEPLTPEDQVVQAIPEASPSKWHLAHTTWFFERFCLAEHLPRYEPMDPRFNFLFNSYYYTVGDMHGRTVRGLVSRPTVHEIREYRLYVDDAMLELIRARRHDPKFAALVDLGLNHEQQHQELLLTDIKQVFFANPLGPAYRDLPKPQKHAVPPLRFVSRKGGELPVGAEIDDPRFHFDNETPRHLTVLGDHSLANRLVTNAEFREFIDAGGYRDPQLWLADGWSRIHEQHWDRPLCWSQDLTQEFTLGGWRPIDPNAPVCHASYYEADAFARWAGGRLPTEMEWELAAAVTPMAGNFLDTGFFQPMASRSSTRSANAVGQLWGDVWEWCSSPYGPYPGFKPLAGSLGEYNGKFMCNQMVVRGGSCVTWSEHVRPTYRSFFYPHDRWQFLGFRLAKDG